jgi:ceramide glucosyltransferase
MGGFEAFKDYLAEDHVIGLEVARRGYKVAIARTPVLNLSTRKSVRDFYERYVRWSIIQRTATRPLTYLGQLMLIPFPWVTAAFLMRPNSTTALLAATLMVTKLSVDAISAGILRGARPKLSDVVAWVLKDVLLTCAWFRGLVTNEVLWRGNRLRVISGSRLVPHSRIPPALVDDAQPEGRT